MVVGFLRSVLSLLGGIAVVWLVLGIAMLPAMERMMKGGMMYGGMVGMLALQTVAMLRLVGIFVSLVVDSVRRRRT